MNNATTATTGNTVNRETEAQTRERLQRERVAKESADRYRRSIRDLNKTTEREMERALHSFRG